VHRPSVLLAQGCLLDQLAQLGKLDAAAIAAGGELLGEFGQPLARR
jgi:hypothetical protein